MNHLARNTAIVLGTLTVLAALWVMREMVVLFLISLAVAAAMRPIVHRLMVRGWRRSLAVGLVYFAVFALLAGAAYVVALPLAGEVREAAEAFARWYQQTTSPWSQSSGLRQMLATRLPPPDEIFKDLSGDRGLAVGQALLGVTWNLFENLVRFLLVFVLSIYWTLDRVHFERLWLSLLPASNRVEARNAWQSVESGVGDYLRSEAVQAALAGMLLAVGYHAMGVRFPTLLTVVGALAWLIPWLGLLLATVPAVLVAWHTSLPIAILTGVYATAVFVVLEFLVEPRFFNRRRYSSLLVALTTVALTDYFGLIGLFFGPPLAVTIQICCGHLLERSTVGVNLSQNIADLQTRLAGVRESLAASGEPLAPEVASVLDRLGVLVDNAQAVLDQQCQADAA